MDRPGGDQHQRVGEPSQNVGMLLRGRLGQAVVVAVGGEKLVVAAHKEQVNPPGLSIHDGAGIADGDFLVSPFFMDQGRFGPILAAILAALQQQVDVPRIFQTPFSTLTKSQQGTFGGDGQGRNAVGVVAILAADE